MQRGQFVRRGRASAPISSIIIIKYWHNELLRGAKPINTPPKTMPCPSEKSHASQFKHAITRVCPLFPFKLCRSLWRGQDPMSSARSPAKPQRVLVQFMEIIIFWFCVWSGFHTPKLNSLIFFLILFFFWRAAGDWSHCGCTTGLQTLPLAQSAARRHPTERKKLPVNTTAMHL